MNANFDPNALGAFFALHQQNLQKQEEKNKQKVTLQNMEQAVTVITENVDGMNYFDVMKFSQAAMQFMQSLGEFLEITENLLDKYDLDLNENIE